MKLMTILGTRPEIIRLSRTIEKLDELCDNVVVHTGQNYDLNLNDIFFTQLELRKPDYYLDVKGRSGELIGQILAKSEEVMADEKPDKLLVLGDTNSALSAIMAKRLGIPVYHMEAGNRCYDDRVPEEVNRRIIDHCSDVLLPYTERSRVNLLREGIPGERTYVTGNPIKEVLDHYGPKIEASQILNKYNLESGKYFLVTLHRAENVDIQERLNMFIEALSMIHSKYDLPIIWSVHPRTREKLNNQPNILREGINAINPIGLFDFVKLEKNAMCVLTDSGTVQEECCIFKVPSVTLRDVTERPETIEVGSSILSGAEPKSIMRCVNTVLNQSCNWQPPSEYLVKDVSSTVVKIVLGHKWR